MLKLLPDAWWQNDKLPTTNRVKFLMRHRFLRKRGFTLIELVMVILLLAVLSAVAIPNFIDFRTDAKNAATLGALGALRSAITIATASIALREDPSTNPPKYPDISEMQNTIWRQINGVWAYSYYAQFSGSHPVLSGTYIMDPSQSTSAGPNALYPGSNCYGIPLNPWYPTATAGSHWANGPNCEVYPSGTYTRGEVFDGGNGGFYGGWLYNPTAGTIWADTYLNGGTACTYTNVQSNNVPQHPTENCY